MAFGLSGSSLKSPPTTTDSSTRRTLWHNNNGKLSKEYCIKMQHNYWKYHCNNIKGGSMMSDKFEKKYLVNATSKNSHDEPKKPQPILESIKDGMDAFRQFSRLYAFFSFISSGLSSSLLAVDNLSNISPKMFLIGFLQFLIPNCIMFQYIVGVNQLADVEIDKINKPYLPLASGKYSLRNAVIVVASSLLMGFGSAWVLGSRPMFWCLVISTMLMTAYSVNLPLLRWKRSTILATFSLASSMTIGQHIAPFLHMKDIPDIEGDKAAGHKTLAIHLGPRRVFWFCISLLQMTYGIAIIMGALSPILWSKIFTVVTHFIMSIILWYRANSVDLSNNDSLQSFYMAIFVFLSVENFLVLFVR
ncbi:naringenin 8-dimethylallyltransferase 2, chloroplastic isoform X2 [Arachis hypogaea]|uniref:naringenin 8-dimethylallyltransferase 2, chloroplastic isoform X2 n=1 Tax=Arachis hypogaea TaxID=3818 RepID=UPI000DED6BD5|nr:naringenin 8-dimethylallyltransferase 2, chloroplastic isoform X2 [Arachis hypogaea]